MAAEYSRGEAARLIRKRVPARLGRGDSVPFAADGDDGAVDGVEVRVVGEGAGGEEVFDGGDAGFCEGDEVVVGEFSGADVEEP